MRMPFGRRNWEQRMDRELRFHLDQQIRDYMERGISRAEAERRARQEFGTLDLAKDECRDQRATEWLHNILRDLRHSFRSLRKSPGFAAAVVATLALGIGANTAIFSLIYSVLLKPLPYPSPDRIFNLGLFESRYAAGPRRVAFFREAIQRVQMLPGVTAAGAVGGLPVNSGAAVASQTIFYTTDTNPPAVAMQRPVALIRSVTPGYFAASGTTLRAGRFFTETEQTPVAIISESLARRLWPREALPAVIGHAVRHGDFNGPPVVVAGIVADTKPGNLDRELPPEVYRPQTQRAGGNMALVIRTAREPAALASAVRAEIRKMDPNLPIPAIRTMREIVSQTVAERRFQMALTLLFALAALCLGAIGIYGVVSYAVACRTRDIGLRIALGALRSDVMRWVFTIGFRPVLFGLVTGLFAAILIGRTLRGFLYGIAPTDPLSMGIVALVLLATAALACYLPARRASRLDPVIALRHE